MFHNVILTILFWLEHKKKTTNKGGISQVAMQAYRYFEILVPVGLHECRPHVCRATGDWVTSKDRLPEVKNLGKPFENIFRHVADRMTTLDSVTDAMSLLCYVIVLLRRDKIKLPGFDETSPVPKHHSRLPWSCWAEEVKKCLMICHLSFTLSAQRK